MTTEVGRQVCRRAVALLAVMGDGLHHDGVELAPDPAEHLAFREARALGDSPAFVFRQTRKTPARYLEPPAGVMPQQGHQGLVLHFEGRDTPPGARRAPTPGNKHHFGCPRLGYPKRSPDSYRPASRRDGGRASPWRRRAGARRARGRCRSRSPWPPAGSRPPVPACWWV